MDHTYSENELLPISGLQHLAFCERQWALIHLEQQWEENRRTAEGSIIHERAHDPNYKTHKPGMLVVRGLRLRSLTLGLYGIADVVEFSRQSDNLQPRVPPRPVEYKRGKSKKGDYDRIQLCAQAMCLEEMMQCHIDEGDLYYAEVRRREVVELNEKLRCKVVTLCLEMHRLYLKGSTPKPAMKLSVCRTCSMKEVCLPRMRARNSANYYWQEMLTGIPEEEC